MKKTDNSTGKQAKKPQKLKKPNSDRPWNTLGGLALGAIIMYTLAWIGALHSGETIAEFYTKDHARDWADAVVANFGQKENSFSSKGLRINDKYVLQDFQKGTNIYRYSVTDASGWVFESSKKSETGRTHKFPESLMRGELVAERAEVPAREIDGYTMQTHAGELAGDVKRQVIEIKVPIMKDGKFIGAVIANEDITSLLSWSNQQARKIALVLCGVISLIMLAIGTMVWSYGSSRIRQANALKSAKAEAETAEHEARQMADQLQVMNDDIGTLNKELNKNMKTLRETQDEVIRKGKMAQLGQLTATVAHDIRNPLGSVRTSAFLLRRKFAADNPTMAKPLDRIENGVERCDGIISELLDFARSKDLNVKTQNFDEWLVGLVREQAEQLPEDVAFECALGLSEKEVSFDSDSLARAVINFLSNASEAMVGKGNEKPENPTENPKIIVSTALSDRGVEISVTDNGPGISDKNLKKILDPLFTTKSFGVGLGLPAVEKIFEQHGGGLEIKSAIGKGSTFTGWIPLERPKPKPQDDREEQAA
jgi:signal transduction histidine kinase